LSLVPLRRLLTRRSASPRIELSRAFRPEPREQPEQHSAYASEPLDTIVNAGVFRRHSGSPVIAAGCRVSQAKSAASLESFVTPSKLTLAPQESITEMFLPVPFVCLLTPHPSLFTRSPLTRRSSLFAGSSPVAASTYGATGFATGPGGNL
jgi:hypothetical protein